MTTVNLDNLSIDQLNQLTMTIDSTLVNKRQLELIDLRDQVDALIGSCPFTLEEVLAAKPVRKPVLPKYKNPQDAEQTWTGRGRRPRWVEDCLSNGMDLTDLLI